MRPRPRSIRSVLAGGGLVLALAATGCRLVSTPIGRVLERPHRYQGAELTVSGRVEAIRWMPELCSTAFRLVDGADSLLVVTLETPPEAGRRIRLQGHFVRNFPLDGGERPVLLYRTGPNGGRTSSTVDPR